MSLLYALIAVATAQSGSTDPAPVLGPARIVVSEAQRKTCKYLGIVSGKQSGGTKNAEKALMKALGKVSKLGGNGLFIITQTDSWLEGTSITGEALLCPSE